MKDVVVVGGGIAGMATAARLQAAGLSTMVIEAHVRPGGCAGYYKRKGFMFDVGATTLVDFARGGVGGELLESIGMSPLDGEDLPGYTAWLPDRRVNLHRDPRLWAAERLAVLGDTPAHRRFWAFMDRLARVFWEASRRGVKLPIRSVRDVLQAMQSVSLEGVTLARFVGWTMADALRQFGLYDDKPLTSLIAMLVEDTVHSTPDDAPLINAALGVTIRGAGLTRPRGGMYGFWRSFTKHYRAMGGGLRTGCRVERIAGKFGDFSVQTTHGVYAAAQVVSAVPAAITARLAPSAVGMALKRYLTRDESAQGGAMIVFLGVPEHEVEGQTFTHHQLLQDYRQPLGDGNNMFVSVSAAGDTDSAPEGHRAVMISTHCDLESWRNLSPERYEAQKQALGDCLIHYARRVYPNLGEAAVVCEVGTPRTYEQFTGRPGGAVGGVRQNLRNSNQYAIPYDVGMRGFWMVGDSTWPGLGMVACVLGSRHVADGVMRLHRR